MKSKTMDHIMMGGLMFALLVNGVGLLIDDFKADTFVCKGEILAEELTPVDIQTMFTTCTGECKTGELNCLKECTSMISDIVK